MLRLVAVLALVVLPVAGREARVERAVSVQDIDGRAWTLLAPAAGQVDLLLFVATDCPISNRYAPEIARTVKEYAPRGVRTFLVYAKATTPVADVRKHQREYGLTGITAIVDARHLLVDAVAPKVTPEAAVYATTGRLYRGRIDDLYADLGHPRQAATRHDVRLALDAALAGKTITPSVTDAFGCFIEK